MIAPGVTILEPPRDELAVLDLPRSRLAALFGFRHWILDSARGIPDTPAIVSGVGTRFLDCGLHLDRMMTAVEVRHSERAAVGRIWEPGRAPTEFFFPHGSAGMSSYHDSPFRHAHDTGRWVRLDLARVADGAFRVVPELKAGGFTDYLAIPAPGAGGMRNGFSFATRNPGGFDDDDLAILRFTMPALAGLMELLVTRRVLAEVARIYLGAEPAKRVLAGDVRRGAIMPLRAVIMFADMRRFTETSMRLTAQQTVDLLNAYYDCVVAPVEARGGEILKFIADGLLAVFHARPDEEAAAAGRALAAAQAALDRVAALNAAGTAPAAFEIGLGLHFGEAAYGNVGSGERQDYTVIGRDVNVAARIAGLCGTLAAPLLVSADCARWLPAGTMRDAGAHPLKGVAGATRVLVPNG
ncbi:MAG: adenylate/guanylate cyclase domain-containing protein [Alphaproteobacteria bacterium]